MQRSRNVKLSKQEIAISEERPDSSAAMDLIAELEALLSRLYPSGSQHGYSVARLLDEKVAFFVIRCNGRSVGCGGLRLFGTDCGEVKRMYIRPEFRGLGLGKLMLEHLIAYARTKGFARVRLETGIHQNEAINLYERMGFMRVGPLVVRDDPLSRFYEKLITAVDQNGKPNL
jgi:GNAT superfamily N-acetyltransferase